MIDNCIEFQGSINDDGYGRIENEGAHRVIWKRNKGPIPHGLHVLHTCDNRRCINLNHLWLGTNQDNIADRHSKGRDGAAIGSANGRSVLDENKVSIIKRLLREDKLSLNNIADEYGVCKSTIVHIKMGRIWSHIQ